MRLGSGEGAKQLLMRACDILIALTLAPIPMPGPCRLMDEIGNNTGLMVGLLLGAAVGIILALYLMTLMKRPCVSSVARALLPARCHEWRAQQRYGCGWRSWDRKTVES
eukprot:COSAG01_NODE_3251_length_6331_cov_8.087944_3_plen_109_part_00